LKVAEFKEFLSLYLPNASVSVEGYLVKEKGYWKLADSTLNGSNGSNSGAPKVGIIPGSFSDLSSFEGSYVQVKGRLFYDFYSDGVYPKIFLSSIDVVKEATVPVNQSFALRKTDVIPLSVLVRNVLAKSGIINILLVYGSSSLTRNDFINGFSSVDIVDLNLFDYVNIRELETKLNDDALYEALSSCDFISSVDAIFLVRGGGDKADLARVGGEKTASFILDLKIPFYLAIGHSSDSAVSVLEQVADQVFPTPSLAGVELAKSIKEVVFYDNLMKEYNNLKSKHDSLFDENNLLRKDYFSLTNDLNNLRVSYESLLKDYNNLKANYDSELRELLSKVDKLKSERDFAFTVLIVLFIFSVLFFFVFKT
jgi:hypothetical protein